VAGVLGMMVVAVALWMMSDDIWKVNPREHQQLNYSMEYFSEIVETVHPWLYRASIYLSNAFLDDPAILAFVFC